MYHNKLVQLTFKMPYILYTNFIEVFLVIPEMRKCQSTDSINWLVVVREKDFVYCQVGTGFMDTYIYIYGPGYLIQYSDSLMSGRSGDRITMGTIFSALVQTGPGAHPASYTLGTGSFSGVKRPGRRIHQPPHIAQRLKKEESYNSTPHPGFRGLFWGEI